VRAETRHQLKQDAFSRAALGAAETTVHWTVEHKSKLIVGGVVAVIVLAVALGGWYYLSTQEEKASAELSLAVRTLDTPLRPAGMPAQPDFPSFASAKERAEAAGKQLQAIVYNYPHTRTADYSRYLLGVTSAEAGDNAAAERNLRESAGSRNAELASIAKLALASFYGNANRNKDAVDLYQQLIAKPTTSVSKVTAQLQLAELYQNMQQPLDAKRIYEQIQKEHPATEAANIASQKLQELNKAGS